MKLFDEYQLTCTPPPTPDLTFFGDNNSTYVYISKTVFASGRDAEFNLLKSTLIR